MLSAVTCACLVACSSDQARPSVLFAGKDTLLDPKDISAIEATFAERFSLSGDGLHFVDENCGEIPTRTEIVDLDGDGIQEVFVYWGNTCTSGSTGSSLSMFAKDNSGHYRDQFGFPAFDYTALPGGDYDYPDLQFGGPGFCFAVWAWTESHYEFKCNAPQEEGGCQYTGNVCQSD